jgi:hypothetical protein
VVDDVEVSGLAAGWFCMVWLDVSVEAGGVVVSVVWA